MATIKDIAKLTGYSVSTISRVLNDYPYVDEGKRQKVLQVMKDVKYIPNRTAQNLSHGKTQSIGIILPFINHPYYDQLLSGIMTAAFAQSYKVTLLPTNYDRKLEITYLNQLASKAFDGLIVATRANSIDTFLPFLEYGPIVFCEATPEETCACSYIDLEGSLTEALRYLRALGIKRLGVILGRSEPISQNSKLTMRLCQEILPEFDPTLIYWDCWSAPDGVKAAAFFKSQQVDGILTNGDEIAATIIQSYGQEKIPVMIGRENLLLSDIMSFSTIDHHIEQCGEMAFKLFHEERLEQVKMPYLFIKR